MSQERTIVFCQSPHVDFKKASMDASSKTSGDEHLRKAGSLQQRDRTSQMNTSLRSNTEACSSDELVAANRKRQNV